MQPMQQIRRINPNLAKNLSNYIVGFDELFDVFEKAVNKATDTTPGFPPRNIIRYNENEWELQYAVAGFRREDLSVSIDRDTVLVIAGKSPQQDEGINYLHRGIGLREFRHEVTIPEAAEVKVELIDGLLKVKVTKPEAKAPEPRLIAIS